jgi:hypothetical protein
LYYVNNVHENAVIFFFPMNQIVCCIASTIETHSVPLAGDREAKNVLFFPFRPILPHAYGLESRYGYGSRQTNSPINPSIGNQTKSTYMSCLAFEFGQISAHFIPILYYNLRLLTVNFEPICYYNAQLRLFDLLLE